MIDLSQVLHKYLDRYTFETCYVACSGGADSMVLLELLHGLGKKIEVFHVNYGLRGEASDQDEALVRRICQEKQVPVKVLKVNLYKELSLSGGNLQQRARQLRYDFFESSSNDTDGVFLAHHFDDQIETFFLALARGGGIRALACMAEKKGRYCRPFLGVSKETILSFAQSNGIRWREDESNLELRYARNRFRKVILPVLSTIWNELEDAIPFITERFQEKLAQIHLQAQTYLTYFQTSNKIPFEWFLQEDGEVVREVLRMENFGHGVFQELKKLISAEKGARIALQHPMFQCVYREDDHFYFQQIVQQQLPELIVEEIYELPRSFDKNNLYVDPDKLIGLLGVRVWKHGDRICPIGINGSKLISDILSDAKIPTHLRKTQIVVHDDEKILWLVGHSVGRHVLASSASKIWKLTVVHG